MRPRLVDVRSFAYDTPTRRRDGTRAQVMARYPACPLERPELLEPVPPLLGRTPARRCAPGLCHADAPAAPADTQAP
ncbi:hypothetical protein [Streptomyces sp. NPDC001139]